MRLTRLRTRTQFHIIFAKKIVGQFSGRALVFCALGVGIIPRPPISFWGQSSLKTA
jgi:hypothetical protein